MKLDAPQDTGNCLIQYSHIAKSENIYIYIYKNTGTRVLYTSSILNREIIDGHKIYRLIKRIKDICYLILNKDEMCVFNISCKFEVNMLYIAISRLQEATKFHPKTLSTTKRLGKKINKNKRSNKNTKN